MNTTFDPNDITRGWDDDQDFFRSLDFDNAFDLNKAFDQADRQNADGWLPWNVSPQSSYVTHFRYNPERQLIQVTYNPVKKVRTEKFEAWERRTKVFTAQYQVPREVYDGLVAAGSKGRYAVQVLHPIKDYVEVPNP